MGELSAILNMWSTTLMWMTGLAISFAVLTRFMPVNPGMYWWKDHRAVMTDLIYWFIMPLIVQIFRILMLMTAVGLFLGIDDKDELQHFFKHGYGPVSEWPIWVQALIILLAQDLPLYWIHRTFHGRRLWRFHAIHHSPKVLDWMSTQRFHLVNNLLAFGVVDTITLCLGFSPAAMVMLTPFNIIVSAMVHSNLNWTFGPFKYVFASPVFHRWHHTAANRGGSKNFAPTFPIIDVIFGTFYMPKGEKPDEYGVDDPNFPEDFVGQFMYPFRKAK